MSKADNNAMESDIEPRVYELGYLLAPSIAEEKLIEKVDALRAGIDNRGGSIIAEGVPALKELAYEMSKMIANKRSSYTSAYFGWMKFEADPSAVVSLKAELESNDDIVRFIIVKTVREDTVAHLPAKVLQGEGTMKPARETGEVAQKEVVAPKPELTPEEAKANDEEIDEEIEKLVIEE